MGPYQRTPKENLLELLDTQVEGSVQWVLLEISWKQIWRAMHRFVTDGLLSLVPRFASGWFITLPNTPEEGIQCVTWL